MVRKLVLILCLTLTMFPVIEIRSDDFRPGVFQGENYFVFSPDGKYLVKVFHSENKTWVRIHETGEMRMLTQWQIPDFKAHTIRFSLRDPSKLLLADKKRLLVYRLIDDKQKLFFFQPKIKGREIVQAYFDAENDEIVWATKSNVFKTDTASKTQQKILSVPWEEGKINSITVVSDNDYAVNLENSNKILMLSSGNGFDPIELNRHKSKIVGIQSPGKDELISLDSSYDLVFWNTASAQVKHQLRLDKPEDDAELLAVALDDPKENLLVLSRGKSETIGQKYSLNDLRRGRATPEVLPMTMTSVGNVYSSVNTFKSRARIETEELEQSSPGTDAISLQQPPLPGKKRNTLLDLAQIEADNGDYEAALELIKKIRLDDPEYGKSRELKRRVLTSIEIRNTIAAARDQYKRGNYKSAKIILDNALIRNPENRELVRFRDRVDEKLSGDTWLKVFLVVFLILLMALLGFILWRYQSLLFNKGRPGTVKKGSWGVAGKKRKKEEKGEDLRRKFVYLLDDTRKRLNQAAARDKGRRYKNTWMEITARLNTMEKRAKLSDSHLAEFISEMEKLQTTIEKLDAQGSKKAGFGYDSQEKKQQEEKTGKKAERESKQEKKQETANKAPDYHAILGVPKGASRDEIKQAYRKKMKEYHPDRHSASDFNWVKEEADRRTRLIQEAYEMLSRTAES